MQFKRTLVKTLGLIAVTLAVIGCWVAMDAYTFQHQPLNVQEEGKLEVKSGMHLTGIARQLHERGILNNPRYLVWWGRWLGFAEKIQAGEYRLEPGLTPIKLLERLVAGDVIQYQLTLVEGWTFRQMLDVVEGDEHIEHTLAGKSDDEIMALLGHPGEHPEGRFFPDTYRFPAATSDVDFLKRAYEAMAQRLAREWEGREEGLPFKTPYEALTLASIVEKETAVAEERPEIAGVFVRRLQKGMRLQTDPTVIYGMGVHFDGNIRRRDLELDTPYNTYTRKGLPPTPIAMPSGEAIHAALHPAPGSSLYFVARGDGSHHFSSTLEEHNEAVRRYQLHSRRGQ